MTTIPISLLEAEYSGDPKELKADFEQIEKYYGIYRKGADFPIAPENDPENNFVPADLRYKISASLINKQARFLFAERNRGLMQRYEDERKNVAIVDLKGENSNLKQTGELMRAIEHLNARIDRSEIQSNNTNVNFGTQLTQLTTAVNSLVAATGTA